MTDRELLELAAKAAGINVPKKLSQWDSYSDSRGFEAMNMDGSAVKWKWNPMNDDGDALKLAVKLKLLIDGCSNCAQTMEQDFGWFYGEFGDEYAKTRRAIVRAAAEIGKAMND